MAYRDIPGRGAYRRGSKARDAFDAGACEGMSAYADVDFDADVDEDRCSAAYEAESNGRQMAGHPTYDLRSDAEWEAYEAGVSAGIEYADRCAKRRAARVETSEQE